LTSGNRPDVIRCITAVTCGPGDQPRRGCLFLQGRKAGVKPGGLRYPFTEFSCVSTLPRCSTTSSCLPRSSSSPAPRLGQSWPEWGRAIWGQPTRRALRQSAASKFRPTVRTRHRAPQPRQQHIALKKSSGREISTFRGQGVSRLRVKQCRQHLNWKR